MSRAEKRVRHEKMELREASSRVAKKTAKRFHTKAQRRLSKERAAEQRDIEEQRKMAMPTEAERSELETKGRP